MIPLLMTPKPRHYTTGTEKEAILIFKGLNRKAKHLDLMARYFHEKYGYHVTILDYPYAYETLEESGDHCLKQIKEHITDKKFEKIHLLGTSRGGLIIRKLLEDGLEKELPNINTCLMLGTPNQGSLLVEHYYNSLWAKPMFTFVCGSKMDEMRSGKGGITTKLKDHFPSKNISLGVIAATSEGIYFPLRYGKRLFPYPGKHDGVVGVEETHLKGTKDHVIIDNLNHIGMEDDQDCLDQAVHFMKHESFMPQEVNRKKNKLSKKASFKPSI